MFPPLQFLADFGHELLLIHLWAEEDRTPPWDGDLELIDAETDGKLEIAFGPDARTAYTEAFDAWARGAARDCRPQRGPLRRPFHFAWPIEDAVFGPLAAARGIE